MIRIMISTVIAVIGIVVGTLMVLLRKERY